MFIIKAGPKYVCLDKSSGCLFPGPRDWAETFDTLDEANKCVVIVKNNECLYHCGQDLTVEHK